MELLQEFNVRIVYRPGTSNIVADSLSRRPDLRVNTISAVFPALLNDIREAYARDEDFGNIHHALMHPEGLVPPSLRAILSRYSLNDRLLWYNNEQMCVPRLNHVRRQILHNNHDAPIAGHPRFGKTYLSIQCRFYWPKMDRLIRRYVTSCDACQRAKSDNRAPAGLLQPLPIPTRPWESVGMDFITHLPRTTGGYDSILVVVCRLSKQALFIPTRSTITAPETATLYFKHIFRLHGLPISIVSDRDPRFTSRFWKELFRLLGTKLAMSTAYHPQTDGQTERTNRTLEQMLRIVVNYRQDDWDNYLSAIEFAYNNTVSATTKQTPFFLTSGQHPIIPSSILSTATLTNTPSVQSFLDRLRAALNVANDNIVAAQDAQSRNANSRRRDESFTAGDSVLLSTKHLLPEQISRRPCTALQPKWVGPYRITQVVSKTAYRIELPNTFRVHPLFHVSQLRRYHDPTKHFADRNYDYSSPIEVNREPEYEVKQLIDKRTKKTRAAP
jgi:transposase InsO family protein